MPVAEKVSDIWTGCVPILVKVPNSKSASLRDIICALYLNEYKFLEVYRNFNAIGMPILVAEKVSDIWTGCVPISRQCNRQYVCQDSQLAAFNSNFLEVA